MNNRIFSLIIGVVCSCFLIGWVSLNPSDKKAMAQFISVENLLSDNLSQRLKLGGIVKDGSISISESNQLECFFVLKEGDAELSASYSKTRPDLFKDGAEVIVTGEYIDGTFMLMNFKQKCASRYEGDLRNEANYKLEELDT